MALDPKEFSAVVKVRAGKMYPDLVNSLALKVLPKADAEAEGWPTFADFVPCQNGHVAPKFCKNSMCVSCWLVRQNRPSVHPRAKDKQYYRQRDPAAPVVATGAPVSAPLPPEPSKVEQTWLAKLAELRDIGKACDAVPGWTIGNVESRCSSNPIFRAAFQDLTDRLGIATRAPDAETVNWTAELERAFSRRYVDCGLIEQTRAELGISASDYHAHLAASPSFAALIAASESLARLTLHDRALASAKDGNDRLLKLIELEKPTDISQMSVDQVNNEIERLLLRFQAQGLIPKNPTSYIRKSTGETIEAADLIPTDDFNADLVGGE